MEATLGFVIDSRPAAAAAIDLDKLTAAAVKTEREVESLEQAARGLGTAFSGVVKGAGQAKPAIDDLGRSFSNQDDHVKAFRQELERLTEKYQPMIRATRAYEASVAEINRAHQYGIINAAQMQRALDAERAAFDRLKSAADGAKAAINQANAANQNVPSGMRGSNLQGFNAANAGYQFQDVAVTAALGMNPLMIGLQQGTQLAAVIGSMERPVSGLAAAFGSLLSPVSLVTIGLTAGAAALIQYVSSWAGGDQISDDLKAQNDLIASVAEKWGDATPRLKAYADELTRISDAQERMAAGNAAAEAQFRPIVDVLGSINEQYTSAIRSLRGYGQEAEPVVRSLTSSFSTLQNKIMDGKATTDDLASVQQSLAKALESSGVPAVQKLVDAFSALVPQIEAATKAASEFRDEGAGSIFPELGSLQGPWSEGGRLFFPEQFIPANPGVPTRRPLYELGEGWTPEPAEPATIVNSDGRLVPVPVPGRRPNYFEREADMPSFNSFRAGRNTYWSREVLDEERRRREMGEVFQGFFSDFGSALRRNGGNLGEALMDSLSNSMMNAAQTAWERLANQLANALLNAVMGPPSAGLMNKAIGFTGANTTLGEILGAGSGLPANSNIAGRFSGLAGSGAASTDVAAYIARAAALRGIDPATALAVARSEGGLKSWNLQSNYMKNGVQEPSFGPYQLYMGGGLGNDFMRKTGLDPRIAANGPAGVDFALDHAAKNGWGAWYGAKKAGIGNFEGIGVGSANTAAQAVDKLAESAGAATQGLDTLGGGLGKLGSSLSSFPAAPVSPGGGLSGWFGGLFGGGMSDATRAKYLPLTGLFADGTSYAPGGLAVVGERGPELVNLPQGAQVYNANKSAQMMADSARGERESSKIYHINVYGGSGDEHIRTLVHQGIARADSQKNDYMRRQGFGDMQRQYASQKG